VVVMRQRHQLAIRYRWVCDFRLTFAKIIKI
jgi:hypothetical protein